MWEILFRHPDFVAVNKPCGVSVHQEEGEVSLTQTLAAQLGLEQVWLLHRLDKLTSGVLLFALNPQSASALAQQFAPKPCVKLIWRWQRTSRLRSKVGSKAIWKIAARHMETDARHGKSRRDRIWQPQFRTQPAPVRPASAYGQNTPTPCRHEKFGQSDFGRYALRREACIEDVPPCMEDQIRLSRSDV